METGKMAIRPETLSALNVLYETHHKSPVQVLVPIVMNAIYDVGQTSISAEDFPIIKKLLSDKLGLSVPHHMITLICDEALREKFLIRCGPGKPLVLDIQKAKENRDAFSSMEETSAKKWEKLRSDIIEVYSENGYGSISAKKVDDVLLRFIKTESSDFLLERTSTDGVEGQSQIASSYPELTRVSMCIADIAEDPSSESYEFLVDLCLGNAVASSVFWWDDEFNETHLDNLDVYIDSPIIFRYLGFGDDGQEEVALDLIETLTNRGAHLYVFEHVLSEVMDIFENAKNWIGNPEYDPARASKTTQKVIERKLTAVELEMIIDEIPDRLEEAKISRIEAISANLVQNHQIDEEKLRAKIESAYEMRDRNMDTTIGVDVKSIGSINKLRDGETILYLNKAKAVLCTSNRTLSEVSFEFECEEYNRPERAIPLCMTDNSLVTIAWLESPAKCRRIAQRRLIAQVNSLIEPTPAIKRRYCEDLRNRKEAGVITETEYLAIIRESIINRILARKTGNDPSLYTGEMLDDAISTMLEEKSRQKNIEIKKRDEALEERDKTITKYRAREDKRAERWGNLLLAVFVAAVTLPTIFVTLLHLEYWIASAIVIVVANVLIAVFSEKIKRFGISMYKKKNPDFNDNGFIASEHG